MVHVVSIVTGTKLVFEVISKTLDGGHGRKRKSAAGYYMSLSRITPLPKATNISRSDRETVV
jgi:hypothetical protein